MRNPANHGHEAGLDVSRANADPPLIERGKLAGQRCVQLDDENRCKIFGDPERPLVCSSLRASAEMCGTDENIDATRSHAMTFLARLERETR